MYIMTPIRESSSGDTVPQGLRQIYCEEILLLVQKSWFYFKNKTKTKDKDNIEGGGKNGKGKGYKRRVGVSKIRVQGEEMG